MPALNVDGVGLGDPQDLIDQIDEDTSMNDLIRIQLEVGQMMMMYTAVSGIIKATTDCEQGIARNMA